jgi:predicted DNA-binding transcriptional regulator AlpA
MERPQMTTPKPADADRLLDRRSVCVFFGNIHPATIYRHIRDGRIPRPVKVGGSSRWLRSECEQALLKMLEARNV